jgi:hypothetical protein
MNFPNHQHPVEDLSNAGAIGIELAKSDTSVEAATIVLPSQIGNNGKVLATNGNEAFWDSIAGSGTVTSVAASSSDLTITGSPITGSGTLGFTLNTVPTTKGGTGATSANSGLNNLLPSQAGNAGKVLITDGSNTAWTTAGGVGTVTSVSITPPAAGITQSGSPITASGSITLALANDLAAVEGLSGIGYAYRAGIDSWTTVSAKALTRVNDTNVTLTLNGNPTTALVDNVELSLGWTGTLAASRGGTGLGSFTTGDLLYASGASTLSKLAVGSSGQVLTVSAGVPAWSSAVGSGTVTSVGISSSDMTVTSSPVTTSGTIGLALNTIGISKGGTGQTTANAALNALLPNQSGNSGKILGTDGTNTSWVSSSGVGTVTSVSVSSTDLSVSGSPITAAGTITLNINNGAVSLAKMSDISTQTILGRNTAGTGSPEALSAATTKSILSLGNVENTALSTWAGSTSLTTLGTIATGVWSGTTIATSKGGTGATTANAGLNNLLPSQTGNSGKVLTTDGSNTSWTTSSAGTVTSVAVSSSDLTVSGSPITSSGTISLTLSTVSISKGGTGATTATAAFDALSPTSSLGDLIYRGASNNVRLAGNATTTRKYLTQTGDGTYSAAPAWGTIAANDVPGSAITTSNADANLRLTLGGAYTTGVLSAVTIDASWNGTLGVTRGGTGIASCSAGDLYYGSSTNTLSKLGIGSASQVLTVSGGLPTWAAAPTSPTSTYSQTTFGGASSDYSLSTTYSLVDFGTSSMSMSITGSGTFRISARVVLSCSNSDEYSLKFNGVSGTEALDAIVANEHRTTSIEAIVTQASTTSYDVYIKKDSIGTSLTALKDNCWMSYIKLSS